MTSTEKLGPRDPLMITYHPNKAFFLGQNTSVSPSESSLWLMVLQIGQPEDEVSSCPALHSDCHQARPLPPLGLSSGFSDSDGSGLLACS